MRASEWQEEVKMEWCGRAGDEERVRKCCLSAATACLCLQYESHYSREVHVCVYEPNVHACVVMCLYVTHLVLHNNRKLSWGHCTHESQDALLLEWGWRVSRTHTKKSPNFYRYWRKSVSLQQPALSWLHIHSKTSLVLFSRVSESEYFTFIHFHIEFRLKTDIFLTGSQNPALNI